jgi:hypothetical protein
MIKAVGMDLAKGFNKELILESQIGQTDASSWILEK